MIKVLFNIANKQIVPMKYNPRDENSIKAVMAKANVVINLIGNMQLSYICIFKILFYLLIHKMLVNRKGVRDQKLQF